MRLITLSNPSNSSLFINNSSPLIQLNGSDFLSVSVQKNKIKTWDQRDCHPNQGCIHTVQKIMKGLRDRVTRCGDHVKSGPPQTLLQLEPENP